MRKNVSPTSFLHEGKKVTDPQAMADLQMDVFTEKTEKLIRELPPPLIDPCKLLSDSLDSWGVRRDARSRV